MQFSFRFKSHRAFSLVALVVCATAAVPSTGRADAPDRSTPKKAAIAFAKAMEASDMDGLKQTAFGTDDQFAAIKGIGDMFSAMKRFGAASVTKFGEKGKLPPDAVPDVPALLEKQQEVIDGDKATLLDKDKPADSHPMALKKEGGLWKVDLNSMPPEMAGIGKAAGKIVTGIDAVTKDVEAGKYKTPEEAMAAMQAAIGAAIQ